MRQLIRIAVVILVQCVCVFAADVEQWDIFELSLPGPTDGNPFINVEFSAKFTRGETSFDVRGFYDGDGAYRVRFSPPEQGVWQYVTASNQVALGGKSGQFTCVKPSANNHGPVRVANRYHFAHADGTRFIPIGTTCYSWAHQKGDLPDKTIETLKTAPFTKLRMCALPTRWNDAEPAILPFEMQPDGQMDLSRFNTKYFQNLDKRVGQLRDIGIEAEIVVFHPYDRSKVPFARMGSTNDDRYVRYLIARLAAYRNVWWSMANEYDLLRRHTVDDWDRLFNIFFKEDHVGHPRSIHQINRPYDHNKPWITHTSAQNPEAVADVGRAQIIRQLVPKPVVFDEVRYEGNISARWGNLTAEDMVRRFWIGTVSGVYVTHGEALVEAEGAPSWLGQGGVLRGQSPARIAFLRKILEEFPDTVDPIDQYMRSDLAGRAGRYYLIYFGDQSPKEWPVAVYRQGIQEGARFKADIIDTWDMTVTSVDHILTLSRKDAYTFTDTQMPTIPLPGKPYIALRLMRVGEPASAPSTRPAG